MQSININALSTLCFGKLPPRVVTWDFKEHQELYKIELFREPQSYANWQDKNQQNLSRNSCIHIREKTTSHSTKKKKPIYEFAYSPKTRVEK